MDWGKLIEKKIREALEKGEFDDLPKSGSLPAEDMAGVPEDMQLAMHVLKTQGFAPDWIEQDKALRARLTEARQSVAWSWSYYRNAHATATTYAERAAADADWRLARARFEASIAQLNKDVFNHNLRVPSIQLQRLPLRLSEEYEALGISR
jgi:DnaJ family protein C protein 28